MKKGCRYIMLAFLAVLICLYSLMPIYWCLRTSFMAKSDLLKAPPSWLPKPLILDNYGQLLGMSDHGAMLHRQITSAYANTIVVCLICTILVCVIAILAGYVFARWKFKGSGPLFLVLMATMVLPAYSVMIPLYRIMTSLGLMDTRTGLIIIYVSAFMPLAVWLMRSFFAAIPKEIEEAAWVDGAGRWRSLLTILPMAMPGLLAVAIITFLSAWSQYAIPLVFASSKAQPLTVFLSTLVGKTSVHYGLMAAGGMLSILPPLLAVAFLNKYLIGGLMNGMTK